MKTFLRPAAKRSTHARPLLCVLVIGLLSSAAVAAAEPLPLDADVEQPTTVGFDAASSNDPTNTHSSDDESLMPSFAPSFDDEEDEDGFGAEFAPSFDDDEDEDGFGADFAPSFDEEDEDGFGADFAPSFDEEDDDAFGADFAPSFDEEDDDGFGADFTPSFEDEDEEPAAATDASYDDEDDYYSHMWESLDASSDAEEAEEAPEDIAIGLGRIAGRVYDDAFNAPLADVTIEVEELNRTLVSGDSGEFFFDVEPGVYTVRLRGLGFENQAFQIEVEETYVSDLGEVRMREDGASMMTVEVEGRMARQGAAAALVQRQQSATTRDAISAEQISKTGDSSASDAARRVVGVTMLDDRYAVIRGLQGRYNQVLLNGIPVMVLNPAYPAAELDLFPASLLANMAVNKVPTASLPGDFAGGLLEIETGDYAEDFELNLGVGISADSWTAFQPFATYKGSSTDFLGFDNGRRGLPDHFQGRVIDTDHGMTRDEVNAAGRMLPNHWNTRERSGLLGLSLSASASDTIELAGDSQVSYRLNFVYRNSPKRRFHTVGAITSGDAEPFYQEKESYSTEVTWGTLGAIRYDINKDHELSFVMATTVLSDDRVEFLEGLNSESIYDDRRELTFSTQRALNIQLLGQHRNLGERSDIRWALSTAQGRNYAPDHRFASFTRQSLDAVPVLSQQPGSSERYFQDMQQQELTARADWTISLGEGFFRRTLGAGALARSVGRDYEARRFRYLRARGSTPADFSGDLEEILSRDRVGNTANFTEATDREGRDAYRMDQTQISAYAMTDLELTNWFRLVGGARLESFVQKMDMAGERNDGRRADLDVLPSGSLIFSLSDKMALRAAYGASVARPQGHEFAATVLQDYQRRRQLQGNPLLRRTFIHNADLRWELFPSPTEVVAATLFYKHFNDHIEDVIVSRNGSLQSQNIPEARDLGVELELQLELERLHEKLRGLSIATNFSYVFSRVTLSDAEENLFTSAIRPMADQSPFIANAILSYGHERSGWQLNLVYNVLGRTLVDVGAVSIADTYRETVHTLDFNARWQINDHWRVNFSISDLIPHDVRYTIGSFDRDIERRAASFGLGATWSY